MMQGNSLALSMASRVCLTSLCWIPFTTSKSLLLYVLIPEQCYPVWSLVLTGEHGEMRLAQRTLEVRGEESRGDRQGEAR